MYTYNNVHTSQNEYNFVGLCSLTVNCWAMSCWRSQSRSPWRLSTNWNSARSLSTTKGSSYRFGLKWFLVVLTLAQKAIRWMIFFLSTMNAIWFFSLIVEKFEGNGKKLIATDDIILPLYFLGFTHIILEIFIYVIRLTIYWTRNKLVHVIKIFCIFC